MQKIKILTLLLAVVSFTSFPRVNNNFTESFINDLVNNNNLEKYILPEELSISQRLGISYDSVKYKFLISYDIDDEIKTRIKNGFKEYEIKTEDVADNLFHIKFSVPSLNYEKIFYFKDSLLISPPRYYSNNWYKMESNYFIFRLSDKSLFNNYSAGKLDKFVDNAASELGFTNEEKSLLQKEKIYYYLCKDEKEVEQLTGYEARGNYILAYDYIVTTYNCHFHELVHLLMNYKLKHLPLYTHPFLQEGLAVALGGRGGLDPGVVLNLGKFVTESEFLSYTQLLNVSDYKSVDPSMSYPLSGLYNLFLLKEIGIKKYTDIYMKYSGSGDYVNKLSISEAGLPGQKKWMEFIRSFTATSIKPGTIEEKTNIIFTNGYCKISETKENYLVEAKNNLLISITKTPGNFTSKKFNEEFPGRNYMGEKYLLKVSAAEVSLYNLFTNNLLANYASGFSVDMKQVPSMDGVFIFTIPKSLFEEDLENCYITE